MATILNTGSPRNPDPAIGGAGRVRSDGNAGFAAPTGRTDPGEKIA